MLRVLQEREYTPLGSTKVISFDSQIVSASSVKLSDAVKSGEFREDLFYRLNVIPLSIPPLRDRSTDKLALAKYFLEKYSKEQGKSFTGFSQDAISYINNYTWPGNVRQMENTIHGACIMNTGEQITQSMLDSILKEHVSFEQNQPQVEPQSISSGSTSNSLNNTANVDEEILPLADVERKAIESAIEKCKGNISQAAALLKVNPSTIYRKMQKW